uniref:Uncharacterized protein n=1 Tax=Nelumbo nucifera TaxID=4432 RepID=A0A822XCN1_NELNU|nr:TPA_asm: hypothetical protein HUJ06_019563 [Nelumbo nucifera]
MNISCNWIAWSSYSVANELDWNCAFEEQILMRFGGGMNISCCSSFSFLEGAFLLRSTAGLG